MINRVIAGILTAVFIAAVYYLLVLFQFPSVPLASGYILGLFVVTFGGVRFMTAQTKGKKADSHVIMTAGILLIVTTYVLLVNDVQI